MIAWLPQPRARHGIVGLEPGGLSSGISLPPSPSVPTANASVTAVLNRLIHSCAELRFLANSPISSPRLWHTSTLLSNGRLRITITNYGAGYLPTLVPA